MIEFTKHCQSSRVLLTRPDYFTASSVVASKVLFGVGGVLLLPYPMKTKECWPGPPDMRLGPPALNVDLIRDFVAFLLPHTSLTEILCT